MALAATLHVPSQVLLYCHLMLKQKTYGKVGILLKSRVLHSTLQRKNHFATKTEKRHYYKKAPVNQSTNRKQATRSYSVYSLSCTIPLLSKWDGILEHSQSFVAQNSNKSRILGEPNFCSEVYRSQPDLQ